VWFIKTVSHFVLLRSLGNNLYFTLEFRSCLHLFSASIGLLELAQAKYVTPAFNFKSKCEKLTAVIRVFQHTENLVISKKLLDGVAVSLPSLFKQLRRRPQGQRQVKNEFIFHFGISQLSRSVQCAYCSQNLFKLKI